MADGKVDREFLRSTLSFARKTHIDRLLYVSDLPIDPADLRGRPIKRKLIYAVTDDKLAEELGRKGYETVQIPSFDYSRLEKIKIALVAGVTAGKIKDGETVLCLTGGRDGRTMDTVMSYKVGGEAEERIASIDAIGLSAEFSSQVVEALVRLALQIGNEGFEGHPVGTIFVVGDSTAVMEKSKQLTINPFQGISEAERNVLDPTIRDAVKNFAVLDGAFVIREDGVVLAAGRYLQSAMEDVRIPLGLGTRHAAAAAITHETKAIAIAVSQTSGSVRIFKGGEIVLELHQDVRRTNPGR